MRERLSSEEVIEAYLLQRLDPEAKAQFEVQLLLDPSLAETVEAQSFVYRLLRRLWRREKRRQLSALHDRLLADAGFAARLL